MSSKVLARSLLSRVCGVHATGQTKFVRFAPRLLTRIDQVNLTGSSKSATDAAFFENESDDPADAENCVAPLS
jgi:hypothetical protein